MSHIRRNWKRDPTGNDIVQRRHSATHKRNTCVYFGTSHATACNHDCYIRRISDVHKTYLMHLHTSGAVLQSMQRHNACAHAWSMEYCWISFNPTTPAFVQAPAQALVPRPVPPSSDKRQLVRFGDCCSTLYSTFCRLCCGVCCRLC
jgi:hypothetical protein